MVRSWSHGVAPTSDRLLAAKRNHRVDRKGAARGNQAGERGDRNEERRHGQDHDRIMRAIFDPASNDAVQSEAERKTGGDAKANTGSGRERHDAQHVAAPRSEGDANPSSLVRCMTV